MSGLNDRLQQGLGHIADRATPSPDAWSAIQTRIADQSEQPETEIIMLESNPHLPRRNRTTTWLWSAAAAVVLIVGGIVVLNQGNDDPAAVFAGDDIETPEPGVDESPESAVGDPSDSAVDEAPATVSSSPTATYDGDGCTYEGPDEFVAGSEVTFTFVNPANSSAGIAVWRLPDGMTAEEILDRGIFNRGSQIPESAEAQLTDSGIQVTYVLSDPGLYALNCADRPDGGPAVDYAMLFTVN